MDLELIKNRKIQSQLRYLQLELEETKIIYEDCLLKFNSDFRNYMMDTQPDLSAPQTSKDTNLEIKTDVEDDTLKQVYRKVAGKTHPDKGGDTDKFKKANEANRNKDLGALMEMAVEVPMDSDMRSELSKHIKAVSDTITNLKTTMAWTWCHVDNHNKDTLKQYILQQLNVS